MRIIALKFREDMAATLVPAQDAVLTDSVRDVCHWATEPLVRRLRLVPFTQNAESGPECALCGLLVE